MSVLVFAYSIEEFESWARGSGLERCMLEDGGAWRDPVDGEVYFRAIYGETYFRAIQYGEMSLGIYFSALMILPGFYMTADAGFLQTLARYRRRVC